MGPVAVMVARTLIQLNIGHISLWCFLFDKGCINYLGSREEVLLIDVSTVRVIEVFLG